MLLLLSHLQGHLLLLSALHLRSSYAIQECIEQNKKSLEPKLELVNRDATFPELPDELFELTHIKTIELSGFNIKTKLGELKKLPHLEEIAIRKCLMHDFPVDLLAVPQLARFHLVSDAVTELPLVLNEWTSLIYLNVGDCKYIKVINGLPPNLEYIHISGEIMPEIPEKVFSLAKLRKLALSGYNPVCILSSVANLKSLGALFINKSTVIDLPAELAQLPRLHSLWLYSTGIETLPSIIPNLAGLRNLTLDNNLLSSLPNSFSQLHHLRKLELAGNNFKEIPQSIFELENLPELGLAHAIYLKRKERNDITSIPKEFLKLKKLKIINLDGNNIGNVPNEIIAQGVDAIQSYLLQLEDQDEDYLFEAKLIILGESGAGKTSLARKLNNPNCRLPKPKETTRGVEVIQYRFHVDAEDFPDAIPAGQQKEFRLNMWNFGGQEIYKATHRFFLSDQAVYLLVVSARS